jgi:glycosyltransferase involved in cell wall biosynthesis
MSKPITVVIPAYKPDQELVGVAQALIAKDFEVLVVNDGSGDSFLPIFEKLSNVGVTVLQHAVNLGKGAALKTAFNYFLLHSKNIGIVTVDADGQHLPKDVEKTVNLFMTNKRAMVLGVRSFSSKVPLRSLIGNQLTKFIFSFVTGMKLKDTQTGLRVIPRDFLQNLLPLKSNHYEFELDMLLEARRQRLEVLQEDIETVYIEENKSSHFNPLIDSMKIYFVLLRFGLSAGLSAICDYGLFTWFYQMSSEIAVGQYGARFFSSILNYFLNKNQVFQSREKSLKPLVKYFSLVIVFTSISHILIKNAVVHLGINVYVAKIGIESLMFIASFSIQRSFIFKR